jgi:hypothetical protein
MTPPSSRQRVLALAAVCAGVLLSAAGSVYGWVPFALAAAGLVGGAIRSPAPVVARSARLAARPSVRIRHTCGGSPTALDRRSER